MSRIDHAVAACLALLLIAPFAAGCDDTSTNGRGPLRCGEGTVRSGDRCVPDRSGGGDAATDIGEFDAIADTTSDSSEDDASGESDGGSGEDGTPANCVEGATRCGDDGVPELCRDGLFQETVPCTSAEICVAGRCVDGVDCTPGEIAGCDGPEGLRVCNSAGTGFEMQRCPGELVCFAGECGTQICSPGARKCEDDLTIAECDSTGEDWVEVESCNPRLDQVCSLGECVSGCIAAVKDPTYIGCEFWSVDLPQYEDPFSDPRVPPHAVVLSNTSDRTAEVRVTATDPSVRLPRDTEFRTIAPGEVAPLIFPRHDVEGTTRSFRSFRISTSEPVIAYQFNPLNDVGVFSNDASLLLPSNAIGRDYWVMSWPSGPSLDFFGQPPQTGWFTIVATAADTTRVEIRFSADVIDGPSITRITRGSTHVFELEQGEVLNFEGKTEIPSNIGDLTGTRIISTRPIVVFGGHEEAVIGEGEDNCCADHLEQQIYPINTWGTRYLAVHSPPRGDEKDYWRVMAARDGTVITTVPPIPDLDGERLNAGEFIDASTRESFEIHGSGPILVGQYIVSQQDEGIRDTKGDPAFVLAVPENQFRSDYALLTPNGYAEDWATVIRPAGQRVELDGSALPDSSFDSFGTREYERAWVPLEPGPHRLTSEVPFGVVMFGYDTAVSYGYPGGLDLERDDESGDESGDDE